MINERKLSSSYLVKRLNEDDVKTIYELCAGNEIFYKYHPPFVTEESILEDMQALPPDKTMNDKFYVGFWENEKLVAIMDLIAYYPDNDTAFIGLFMMNAEYQGQGIGTKIIEECLSCLKHSGFKRVALGVDKENPQSNAFWQKNNFAINEASCNNQYAYMERML